MVIEIPCAVFEVASKIAEIGLVTSPDMPPTEALTKAEIPSLYAS